MIAANRRARFEYQLEDRLEAGIALEGWEVKSLRSGRAQLTEGYVAFRNGEAYLEGTHISPLPSASTHVETNPVRSRRLLLHRREIDRLAGAVQREGYTVVPLDLHWSQGPGQARHRDREGQAPRRQAGRGPRPRLAARTPTVDEVSLSAVRAVSAAPGPRLPADPRLRGAGEAGTRHRAEGAIPGPSPGPGQPGIEGAFHGAQERSLVRT